MFSKFRPKAHNTIINTSNRNYALLLSYIRRRQYIRRYNNKINSTVTNVELDEWNAREKKNTTGNFFVLPRAIFAGHDLE